jgi:trehalose 6-phosphate phosphatase
VRLLGRLERELGDGAGLITILDYDGTLAPIAPTPGAAMLAPSVRATLARLAESERARLAILSGRALADVRTRVGVDAILYGGCHGLEIEGPGVRFRHPRVRPRRIAEVRRALVRGAAEIPGARVEFKGLCVSLHYRSVAPRYRSDVLDLVERTARLAPDIAVIDGRKVFDFVPRVGWTKGEAARWIVRHERRALPRGKKAVVLYAGDDSTDEAAFEALRDRGVTVRIGARRGAAEYWLDGVAQMHRLLRWLVRKVA